MPFRVAIPVETHYARGLNPYLTTEVIMSSIHELAVATDTTIADFNTRIAKQRRIIDAAQHNIEVAKRAIAQRAAKGLEPISRPYGIDIDEEQARIDAATFEIEYLRAEAEPFHEVYDQHRWSRFFLVLNVNGHIHSSTSCSTCFVTTDFGWLTDLSGLTEAEAVASHGEILCSVCFPSAPVEWTNGTSNADKEAKAERAAAKAERLAKKTAKALVPEDIDGGLVFTVNGHRERITTIAAAKSWLTDAADWNTGYPRTWDDGTVAHHHPSYPPEAVALVAEVYAARIGSTPEAEIAAAQKRAAKRR